MRKGALQKFIDKKFEGSYVLAANEMVMMFVSAHGIAGSSGYDLYSAVQGAWEKELARERKDVAALTEYERGSRRLEKGKK